MQGSENISRHDFEEEIDDFICNECNEKVELDAISSHNCFIGKQNVYFSGRYVMKTAMLSDNDNSQTSMESDNKQDTNTPTLTEDEDLLDDVLSWKSVLWNSKAIKCLLSIYPKYKRLLDKRKFVSKKQMYTRIHKKMSTYGYTFTSMQIENKMKALEKAYKKRLLNKGPKKSGRGRMCLEFENELQDIFGKVYSIIPPVLMGTNCLVINNSTASTSSEATDPPTDSQTDQETSMKSINVVAQTEDNAAPFQQQDICAIDNGKEECQKIIGKENIFRENDKQETSVEKNNKKLPKRESAKNIREKQDKEKASRQHEYLKLKRIKLKLKAKKYKAKYNIDIDNDIDDIDEML
nr:PREDICTED: uncharacterized protein LOC105669028 [Linepithema humile]